MVCLSLLGTWQGQGGEQWNEKTSTVLQVVKKNFFSITGSLYKQVYTPEIKGSNKDAGV
mgnify:FL=1